MPFRGAFISRLTVAVRIGGGIGAGGSVGRDTSVSDIAGHVIRGRVHPRGHTHAHVIRAADGRRDGGRRIRNKTQGVSGQGSVGLGRVVGGNARAVAGCRAVGGVVPAKYRQGGGVRGQVRAYNSSYVKSGRARWSAGHGERASRLGVCRGARAGRGVLPHLDMCDYPRLAYHAL